MISNFNGWLRSRTYDLWIGLKPSRIGLLTVLVLMALLFETATEQGRDVLLETALADPSADYSRFLLFYAATFVVAVLVWITCWVSSAFRFEKEEDVLRQYRRLFPRSPLVKGTAKAKADAEQRVANIYRVREWAPRVLGILVLIIVAGGFVAFAGKDGIDNAFICLGLALLLAVLILPFLRETSESGSMVVGEEPSAAGQDVGACSGNAEKVGCERPNDGLGRPQGTAPRAFIFSNT